MALKMNINGIVWKVPKIAAIKALVPDSRISVHDDVVTWYDGNPTNITEEQIATKLAELQAEYAALAYARKRKNEYPHWREFMEAYTEKEFGEDSTKMDAYKIKYEKVRTENPK